MGCILHYEEPIGTKGRKLWLKSETLGAAETTSRLGALAVLLEDCVQFPAPMWKPTTISNSIPRGSDSSIRPQRGLHAPMCA